MNLKSISVIGLGYIGLPTASMFASKGSKVVGVDINEETVKTINAGKIHIIEPKLDLIVENAVKDGNLRASSSIEKSDIFIIAVPTPFLSISAKDSIPKPDLSYIKSAAKSVAKVLKKGDLVILESTSPVGTTETLSNWLAKDRPDLSFPHNKGIHSDIRIAYCPERVLPGNIINELVKNDRVIGGMTEKCSISAKKAYQIFVEGNCFLTNARTAEMVKLTENASRDVGIAFANELSMICDDLDIDVWELIDLSNRHPRVNILEPGPGVGGHCIAVDPWFIVSKSPKNAKLIRQAREVNNIKPLWVVDKVKLAIAEIMLKDTSKRSSDITIACYGLAFKKNIDDLRESPALSITKDIAEMHSGLTLAVEPNINVLPKELCNLNLCHLDDAISQADIHLLLVDHSQFIIKPPTSGTIIDSRGIWSK